MKKFLIVALVATMAFSMAYAGSIKQIEPATTITDLVTPSDVTK